MCDDIDPTKLGWKLVKVIPAPKHLTQLLDAMTFHIPVYQGPKRHSLVC